MSLTPTRIVACSPNQHNSGKRISQRRHSEDSQRSPHSEMQTQKALEIKEEPQPKGNKKSCLTKTKKAILGSLDSWADFPLPVLGHRWTYDQSQHEGCGLSWSSLDLDLSCSVLSTEDSLQYEVAGVREADHPLERMWTFHSKWCEDPRVREADRHLERTSAFRTNQFSEL